MFTKPVWKLKPGTAKLPSSAYLDLRQKAPGKPMLTVRIETPTGVYTLLATNVVDFAEKYGTKL